MAANATTLSIKKPGSGSSSSSSGSSEQKPRSRDKNPWLDEEVIIACANDNTTKVNAAFKYYFESDFQKYLNVKTEGQNTALHAAVDENKFELVERFIKKGACIHSTNENGNAVLHVAAMQGRKEIIKTLLDNNANPFLANKFNQTAVDLALLHNQHHLIVLLCDHMKRKFGKYTKDIKKWNETNEAKIFTALMPYSEETLSTLQKLLSPGVFFKNVANINVYHITNCYTPLHFAIEKCNGDTVKLLVEKGANINAINHNSETPLHLAVRRNSKYFVEFLLALGANISIYNNNGQLPVDIALALRQQDIIELFDKFSEKIAGDIAAKSHVKLFNILKAGNGLTELTLQDNIDDYHAQMLAEGIKNCNTLIKINLSNNSIGDEGAKAIAKLIKKNQCLTYLDLSHNQIGDSGCNEILQALANNHDQTQVNFSHNKINLTNEVDYSTLWSNPCLEQLDLSGNEISIGGYYIMQEELTSNHTLKRLNLSQCGGGFSEISNSAAVLASVLRYNETLLELNLSGNAIDAKGATALADALHDNHSLRKINLSNNNLKDEGAAAFAKMLCKNETLLELDLSSNQIGFDGAKRLANAIEKNQFLTELSLNNNDITDLGVLALVLARSSQKPCLPIALYMGRNRINPEIIIIIADVLRYSDSLGKLAIYIGNDTSTVNFFSTKGFPSVTKEEQFYKQLLDAAKEGNINTIASLLNNEGVSPLAMAPDEDNMAIHWAVLKGHVEVVQFLAQEMRRQNISLRVRNRQWQTPLELAQQIKHQQIIEILQPYEEQLHKDEKPKSSILEHVENYLQEGCQFLADEEYAKALEKFEIALKLQPQNVHILVLKGSTLQKLDRLKEAKEAYETAAHIEDKNAEKYLQQAKKKLEEIDKQQALQQSQEVTSKSTASQATDREELLGRVTSKTKSTATQYPLSQNRSRYQFSQNATQGTNYDSKFCSFKYQK